MTIKDSNHKDLNGFDARHISDSICILPFISLSIHATGQLTRCQMSEVSMGELGDSVSAQRLWSKDKMVSLRKKMCAGEWDSGCLNCFNKEKRGLKSKRIHWQNLKMTTDLWKREDIFQDQPDEIYHLDIAFNNFCNFKCRMCSSAYSSQWVKDEEYLMKNGLPGGSGGFYKKTAVQKNRALQKISKNELKALFEKIKNVRRIEILGGEPFLTPEFPYFLELCEQYGIGPNTEIMITTNGSAFDDTILKKLQLFKYVNLNISIDGTGPYYEYIRSSGTVTWKQISKNVDKFISFANIQNSSNKRVWKINLNGAFQIYNMLNLTDFLSWIFKVSNLNTNDVSENSKFRNSFEHRILMGPIQHSIFAAPPKLLEKSIKQLLKIKKNFSILEKISEKSYIQDIENALIMAKEEPIKNREVLWHTFCRYTQLLDKTRNQNINSLDSSLSEEYQKTVSGPEYLNYVREWNSGKIEKWDLL